LDATFCKLGFLKLGNIEPCIYHRNESDGTHSYIAVYVDDILAIIKRLAQSEAVFNQLSSVYKLKDMGEAMWVLGIHIQHIEGIFILFQATYLRNMLEQYGMSNSHHLSIPIQAADRATANDILSDPTAPGKPARHSHDGLDTQQEQGGLASMGELAQPFANTQKYCAIIGKLNYAMVCTHPDLAFAVSNLSCFMVKPLVLQWKML